MGLEESGLARLVRERLQAAGPAELLHERRDRDARLDHPHRREGPAGRRRHPHRLRARLHQGGNRFVFDDYVELGGELGCRNAGKLRQEGKEYVVQDGDVMHFKFNV